MVPSSSRNRADGTTALARVVCVGLALLAVGAGTAEAASLPAGPSTRVSLPANAFYGPFSYPGPQAFGHLSGLACPPSGSCVAVGSYALAELSGDALAVSESAGAWNQPVEIAPPSSPGSRRVASLDAVACPASGSCTAIGHYLDSSGEPQEMAVSESGGVWGQAISIPGVRLHSIACRAPGSCVAIGTASSGSTAVMGVIESGGAWGQPQAIALPANAATNYQVGLSPLACPASGPCVSVGQYADLSLHHARGLGVSESNGVWKASEVKSTPNNSEADTSLYSVACPASGPCVAVGLAGGLAVGVSESNGEWGGASVITPASNPLASVLTLSSVACPGTGRCFAIGYDETNATGTNAVVVSASGGVWGQASEVAPPSDAASKATAGLNHVACTAADSCVATGEYSDGSLITRTMAVSESNGEWGQPSEILAPPVGSATPAPGRVDLLACTATEACAALGRYWDEAGNSRLMAGGTTTPAPAAAPPPVSVPVASLSLRSSLIAVHRRGRAAIRLSCVGTARCAGTLELTARGRKRSRRHRGEAKVIADAHFAIAPNANATIEVKLNRVGRALLKSARGRLSATLVLVKTSPAPVRATTLRVHLSRRR
jgi:hypothetical protein